MNEELKRRKEELNGLLKEMGMDLLINFERPHVPLWKYIISHCQSKLFFLFPFIINSYLCAHKLLIGYSHLAFFIFILSITCVFYITYKMFSLASIISEMQSLSYSFKIAFDQTAKSRMDVIEEINKALGYDLIYFEQSNPLQPEKTATVLPFKKPKKEPKLN